MSEPLPADMFDELCPSCAWAQAHWDQLLDARESYNNATHTG